MRKDNKERCQEEKCVKNTNNLNCFGKPKLAYRMCAIRDIENGTLLKPYKVCLFGSHRYIHTTRFLLIFPLFLTVRATKIAVNGSFSVSMI